jgi:hypothetical protein
MTSFQIVRVALLVAIVGSHLYKDARSSWQDGLECVVNTKEGGL